MRLFIAIRLTKAMKDALRDVQSELYARGVRGNFTPEENLHLTLAFIGEYPDADAAAEALGGVSFAPFTLRLAGLGCFGDLWWAGTDRSEELSALARRVRRALSESGIPFDRKRFSSHITLLRKARGAVPPVAPAACAMSVEAISLMRSDRGKHGMLYTELARIPAGPGGF